MQSQAIDMTYVDIPLGPTQITPIIKIFVDNQSQQKKIMIKYKLKSNCNSLNSTVNLKMKIQFVRRFS